MIRDITLEEISDGNLYETGDMVKADCLDCKGCSDCCRGMEHTITLNPLDVFRLKQELGMDFNGILARAAELVTVEGILLPILKMNEKDQCVFLNEQGRCMIHTARPDICRLFPLGRYYKDRRHYYILQVNECSNKERVDIEVSKWIAAGDTEKFESFIDDWHYLLKDISSNIQSYTPAEFKKLNMQILNLMFVNPFMEDMFYTQFQNRLINMRKNVKV